MKKKCLYRAHSFLILCVCLTAIACEHHSPGESETRIVTDLAGRAVEVPAVIKSAYINKLSAHLIYAFDTIIPVNSVFEYTEAEKKFLKKSFYENKPFMIKEGGEEMMNLKPDVIFYSEFTMSQNTANAANEWQELIQTPVIVTETDMHRYKETLAFLGDLLQKKEKAGELIGFIETHIDPIAEKIKAIPAEKRKRVYYAEGDNGLKTDPAGSPHSLLIDLAGGINVADVEIRPDKGLTDVSMKQIYEWEPDIILVWSGSRDTADPYKLISSDPAWAKLAAVKDNKVYQAPSLPFGWIDRPPGMNRLIGYIWLANLLYPEVIEADMVAVAREFFRKFYHYEMTNEEVAEILSNLSSSYTQFDSQTPN